MGGEVLLGLGTRDRGGGDVSIAVKGALVRSVDLLNGILGDGLVRVPDQVDEVEHDGLRRVGEEEEQRSANMMHYEGCGAACDCAKQNASTHNDSANEGQSGSGRPGGLQVELLGQVGGLVVEVADEEQEDG